eukprot:SAG22_NODE_714_length_7722_cov_3.919585_7_plen_168_part_00
MVHGITGRLPVGYDTVATHGQPQSRDVARPGDYITEVYRMWDEQQVQGSEVVGWWADKPVVETNDAMVKATAYVRPGRVLVVIASWHGDRSCMLLPGTRGCPTTSVQVDVDWDAINMTASTVSIVAPSMGGSYFFFQNETNMSVGMLTRLEVAPKRGLVMVLRDGLL